MAMLLYFKIDKHAPSGEVVEANYDDDTFMCYTKKEMNVAMKYGDHKFIRLHGGLLEYYVNTDTITKFYKGVHGAGTGHFETDQYTTVEFTDQTCIQVTEEPAEIEVMMEGE